MHIRMFDRCVTTGGSIHCYIGLLVYFTTFGLCVADHGSTTSRISISFITENTVAGEAVENAVEMINDMSTLLPNTVLDVKERRLIDTDPFNAMQTACQYIGEGAVVILSSTSCPTAIALQTLANSVHVPHIMVPTSSCRMLTDSEYTISMQPEEANMEAVLVSIVKTQGWRKIAILYDTEYDKRAQRIKDGLEGWNVFLYKILIEETQPTDAQYIHGQLLDLMSATTTFHFIVVADSYTCGMVMTEAHRLGMTKKKYTWVIANEAFDITDMPTLEGSRASVMIVREGPSNMNFTSALVNNKPDDISDKYLFDIYDAMTTIAHAINTSLHTGIDWASAAEIDCTDELKIWEHGSQFMNVLKTTQPSTVQGNISLHGRHYKKNLQLQILMYEPIDMKWIQTGTWDAKNKLNLIRSALIPTYGTLPNRKLTVVTVVEAPFVEMKVQPTNMNFTGFCMDLLDKLAGLLNFEFDVYSESEYGKLVDGQWTGAVGAVAYKRADMAVSGMIVTSSREKVVDFSHSYKDYKVAILIKRNTPVGTLSFRFLDPLETVVWLYIGMCTALIGLTLFLITRFSPYAKVTHAGDTSSDYEKFTLLNSIWFTVSSIMQQGGDMHPRSLSGRIMGAFWWFFTLIIIATYTANLAAFLTVNRMETPINSLDELVSQPKSRMKYGTVRNSPVQEDLVNMSQHNPTYEKISLYFDQNPEVLVETDEAGYEKVRNDNYAFMWDDAVLQYRASLDCDLTIVANQFLRKAYAIALQKNSPIRQDVSQALLQLQEDGILDRLWSKWFTIDKRCFDKSEAIHTDDDAKGIEMETLAGVFYVLIFGTILAFFAAIAEIFWSRRYVNLDLYPDTTYLSHPRWVALPPKFTGDVVPKKEKMRRSSTSISLSSQSIQKISLSNHSMNRITMPRNSTPLAPRYPHIAPVVHGHGNTTCVAHLVDFTGHQEATV